MASTHIVLGTVIAASGLALLMACSSGVAAGTGDGGTSGSSGSGTSGSGTSGSGTSGSGTSGSGTSGGGTSGPKTCGSANSTCTDAETQAYSQCIFTNCDTQLTACYGSGFKSGTFGGPCGTYITCTNACACGDTACSQKCGTPDSACTTCLTNFSASKCTAGCTAPACLSGGSSGSSGSSGASGSSGGATHSCADLQTCCGKIADANTQTSCNQAYDAVKTSEASCNAVYASYAASCP